MTDTTALRAIAERLRERAKQDRSYAVNNSIVADLLQPQMDAFEARDGHNVYAVRMAIDHRNSAKRDNAWADDLEEAANALDHIDAQARALEERSWRPIETAPEDDRLILVVGGRHRRADVVPSDVQWWRNEQRSGSGAIPTHWQPLPEPPASQSLARQEGVEG